MCFRRSDIKWSTFKNVEEIMEFSLQHRKKIAGRSCCVKSCGSKRYKGNLSFHRISRYGSAKIARTNLFGNVEFVKIVDIAAIFVMLR